MTYKKLVKGISVAGEIVYDSIDDVNDKNIGLLMRVLNRKILKQLSSFCKTVNGVSYATEKTIQSHYPSRARMHSSNEKYFELCYSTITLNDTAFTDPRKFDRKKSITVALSDVAMNTERKGERTLINAVKIATEKGYNVKAVIIGDGSKKKNL